MEFLNIAKLLHLTGLILGLGGAMLADFTALSRGVIRPVSNYTIHQVEFLSKLLLVGLALLWLSGGAIIWLNTLANPEYITNQKLWAKLVIVCVLTLNGLAVHRIILPHLKNSLGNRLFDGVSINDVAMMTLIGSFSFVSWTMPMILAKASELNYVTPIEVILAVYALCVLIAWLVLFITMSSIATLQRLAQRAAAMTLKTTDEWESEPVRLAA
jgi:hypothetical protein